MVKFSRLIGRTALPGIRGYWGGVYREDQVNDCPGCGRNHWHVGRLLAECAFCTTAVPLENAMSGSTIIQHRNMGGQSKLRIAA